MENEKKITITINEELHEELKSISKRESYPIDKIIIQSINEFLHEYYKNLEEESNLFNEDLDFFFQNNHY